MGDAISLLALPFAASVVFVLIHAYLGVHVLRRQVVFADLALAQLSALGASVAFAGGYAPSSAAGFGYAMLFTAIGAALLTLTRRLARFMSREAFIGILYVVATAATILVVDRAPQGAEHVKRILLGTILAVTPEDIARFATLYAAIGLLHWLARKPMLAVSSEASPAGRSALAVSAWDFVFFLSFGLVVASSVPAAGVLLVFSFLIVPAVIGSIFSHRMRFVLPIAWSAGIIASAIGLGGAYVLDLPTGAALVTAFALVLVLAGIAKALIFTTVERRRANRHAAARGVAAMTLALVLLSSVWLIAYPAGDQPLARIVERVTGLGPAHFLSPGEREVYQSAAADATRFQAEADRLDLSEKSARYQAAPLSDDQIRRIASYQQTFNEMARGERFVQDVLRAKAHARERWIIGLPLTVATLLGLALLVRPHLQRGARRFFRGDVA